jgi:hypothetical protein
VFGPIKYALLPQHLHEEELVAGNALIEAGTFLSILLGTILGASVVLLANGALIVGGLGVVAASIGWLASRQIPAAPPAAGAEAPRPRFIHDTIAVVGHVTARPTLLLPILAASWFWLFGLIVVSGLAAFAKDVLFANEQVVTMMLALFAVGVGIGSIVAERLLHGEVSARYVPIAAVAMAFFAWDLHVASMGRTAAGELATVMVFLRTPGTWRILDRSRWCGDGRRSLYGAAVRDPSARKRARTSRSCHRREQHHQRRCDGRGDDRIGSVAQGWSDDGRAVRAVRHPDDSRRTHCGVDPATDAREERRSPDLEAPVSREGRRASSTRARRCRRR